MKKFNLYVFSFLIITAILLLRIERLIDIIDLTIKFLELCLINIENALEQLSYAMLELISVPLILIGSMFIIFKYKLILVKYRLNFTTVFSIIFFAAVIFSPLLITQNPERINNLRVAKLLPPFTKKVLVEINKKTEEDSFEKLKNKFISDFEDENMFLADSIDQKEYLVYQKNNVINLRKKIDIHDSELKISSMYFLFGTDELGRDVFSRLIYGLRFSIFIALVSVLIAIMIAGTVGFFAGFYSGFIGEFFNKVIDIFLAFPMVFLIIILLALFGNSMTLLIIILGITGWMTLAKIIRSEISITKRKDFITADVFLGYSKLRLFLFEMLPAIFPPVIVNIIFLFVGIIIVESSLSFLGLGVQNEFVTIGGMINDGQKVMSNSWWVITFPCIVLVLCLLSINSLGKYLEKKINPKLEK